VGEREGKIRQEKKTDRDQTDYRYAHPKAMVSVFFVFPIVRTGKPLKPPCPRKPKNPFPPTHLGILSDIRRFCYSRQSTHPL